MAGQRPETIRARRNVPLVHPFTVTDAAGASMDLTGHTAGLQVRLYGMQPGDPLLDLGMVTDDQTLGLMITGSEVRAFFERIPVAFMPSGNVEGRDDRFAYDLILTAPDGYSWVERWGPFEVTEGVTGETQNFLTTETGAVLTTDDGKLIEAV